MNNLALINMLSATSLSGWDFLIAGFIVLAVEFIIKKLLKNSNSLVWKIATIVLGIIVYVVIALIQKSALFTAGIHGLGVGLAAMGSYDAILKTIKDAGLKNAAATNDAIKAVIENKDKAE